MALNVLLLLTYPQAEPEIQKLIRQLGSEDFERREFASWALRRMGNSAIPDLRIAASHKDSETAYRSAEVLGEIEQTIESPILRELIEVMLYKEPDVSENAKVERLTLELLPARKKHSRIVGLVHYLSTEGLRIILTEAFDSTIPLRFGSNYQFHILDRKGKALGTTFVSPGCTQRDINECAIVQIPEFVEPLLRVGISKIKLDSTESEEHRRYFAVRNGSLLQVRIETSSGKPLRDLHPNPEYPRRTAREWIDALGSGDMAGRLQALAWLGAPQPSSWIENKVDLAESEASIAIEVREAAQDLLHGLVLSSNRWEREAARMASER